MNITTSRLKTIIMQEAKNILKESLDTTAKYVPSAYDLSTHTHDPKTFVPSSGDGKPDPSSFMRDAKKAGINWSEEKIYDFGKFIGFDAFFAAALLPQIARFDWDFDRALKLSTDDRSTIGSFLHALWVKLRRQNVKAFLKELNLPADGPGIMIYDVGIDPATSNGSRTRNSNFHGFGLFASEGEDWELQEKNERWNMLKYLYNARIIRWTGQGFIGPCPMLENYMRNI